MTTLKLHLWSQNDLASLRNYKKERTIQTQHEQKEMLEYEQKSIK